MAAVSRSHAAAVRPQQQQQQQFKRPARPLVGIVISVAHLMLALPY